MFYEVKKYHLWKKTMNCFLEIKMAFAISFPMPFSKRELIRKEVV